MKMADKRRGMITLFALIFLLAMSGLALGLLRMFSSQTRVVKAAVLDWQAFHVAEAGLAKARYALTTGGVVVPSLPLKWTETASPFGAGNGTYTVTVEYTDPPSNTTMLITSTGYIPNSTSPLARRVVTEANVQRGVSSNLSIQSGVAATASSTQGGNIANYARDNSALTSWKSSVKGASWLALDFGTARTFTKIILVGRASVTSTSLSYSNDGVSWSPISATENPAGSGVYLFAPVAARYVMMSVSGNKPSIQEFQTFGSSGTALTHGAFGTSQ